MYQWSRWVSFAMDTPLDQKYMYYNAVWSRRVSFAMDTPLDQRCMYYNAVRSRWVSFAKYTPGPEVHVLQCSMV